MNRYEYFVDDDAKEAVDQLAAAKDAAKAALLRWQDGMERKLVTDILEALKDLAEKDLVDEVLYWKSCAAMKMLVSSFAGGILYARQALAR